MRNYNFLTPISIQIQMQVVEYFNLQKLSGISDPEKRKEYIENLASNNPESALSNYKFWKEYIPEKDAKNIFAETINNISDSHPTLIIEYKDTLNEVYSDNRGELTELTVKAVNKLLEKGSAEHKLLVIAIGNWFPEYQKSEGSTKSEKLVVDILEQSPELLFTNTNDWIKVIDKTKNKEKVKDLIVTHAGKFGNPFQLSYVDDTTQDLDNTQDLFKEKFGEEFIIRLANELLQKSKNNPDLFKPFMMHYKRLDEENKRLIISQNFSSLTLEQKFDITLKYSNFVTDSEKIEILSEFISGISDWNNLNTNPSREIFKQLSEKQKYDVLNDIKSPHPIIGFIDLISTSPNRDTLFQKAISDNPSKALEFFTTREYASSMYNEFSDREKINTIKAYSLSNPEDFISKLGYEGEFISSAWDITPTNEKKEILDKIFDSKPELISEYSFFNLLETYYTIEEMRGKFLNCAEKKPDSLLKNPSDMARWFSHFKKDPEVINEILKKAIEVEPELKPKFEKTLDNMRHSDNWEFEWLKKDGKFIIDLGYNDPSLDKFNKMPGFKDAALEFGYCLSPDFKADQQNILIKKAEKPKIILS